MSSKNILLIRSFVGLTAAAFLFSVQANAASSPSDPIKRLKSVYDFKQPPFNPTSLLRGGDGNFYGASSGGRFGVLFKVTPSGAFSVLHDFSTDPGGNPIALILGKDGNLYGILSSNGAIFKCTLSGDLVILSMPGSAVRPAWLLQGSDGNFYGTTTLGGAATQGSVFRLTPAGEFTTIYSFFGGSEGSQPNELIEGTPGVFYGNCYGSSDWLSAVFRVTLAGAFSVVRDLDGSYGGPEHLVYGSDGNIYGSYKPGNVSIFRMNPNGDVGLLCSFGSAPVYALIEGGDGNLYCSTALGQGAIVRVTLDGRVTTLYNGSLASALSYVSDQGLFGVALFGSISNFGTMFRLELSGQFTTLVRFGVLGGGFSPNGALLQASDGSFYGETTLGGSGGYGTLYHLKSSGELVTLHEFGGDSGASPSLLIMAGDGRLYGGSSGLNGKGSVFRVEPSGEFKVLHEFADGEDGWHAEALVTSQDGNIYGVASSSTNSGRYGSFFRITPAGVFGVIKVFDNSDGGAFPVGLVEAKDGKLYGLASYANGGTLFRITPEGLKTNLHTFPPGEVGTAPRNLVAGPGGNLYGSTRGSLDTTHGGHILAAGTVFQYAPDGVFKIMHSFPGGDSIFAPTSLLPASDGNLYGLAGEITQLPTVIPNSIVYRLTPDGVFTPLYKVSQSFLNALVEGVDGNFYGTTPNYTGPLKGGTVFQFIFGTPSAVNMSTRMKVGTGDDVSIGGFIITGSSAKKVMLRAIGPSLAVGGQPLSGRLDDPMLELHDGTGAVIGKNDNWRTTQIGGVITSDQSSDILASTIAPTNDRESAIMANLQPGNYTAIVSGSQNTTGIGLVEIYDLAIEANAQLANISTRAFVDTGDNVLIGGFIVDGSPYTHSGVVVRAIGPSLSQNGISNLLQDPSLLVFDQNGGQLGANDDWRDGNQPEIVSFGLTPKDDRESALYLSLPAGNYTAIVSGKGGATGVALVETFNVQ